MGSGRKPFPLCPPHPERLCWGCDLYCPAGQLRCGNGSERTQHPIESFGPDWASWGLAPSGNGPASGQIDHTCSAKG
ncbi:DUF3079 domain-containing protein [Ideonella paludis]|uniref:DUF3079 domain-containing protein n=1 Tax=Ideonella paludis TaxID=1233411 RepID=A0ABS5E337_9BURK|nr:DUF3079 domain-containing protein [Ideonella paludis]MBQ0936292.1 DUF3079 domain-containing protein [Ideonella paludis]MBQ0937838.1 DUF3079 domain-containing protein [Ideonella paludis]